MLYNSESDIAGFQFHVDGDLTLTNVSGGAAEAAGFMISLNGETNMVIGFSLDGSVVPAGSGTLLTLEYEGDGSPCLSDLILSDPDANGLDATVEDCLTIFYEDRKSTRLNSSHVVSSYAVFCLKKKMKQ